MQKRTKYQKWNIYYKKFIFIAVLIFTIENETNFYLKTSFHEISFIKVCQINLTISFVQSEQSTPYRQK